MSGYSQHLQSLIEVMLDKSPVRRPSLDQILEHPAVWGRSEKTKAEKEIRRMKAYCTKLEKKLWEELGNRKLEMEADLSRWRQKTLAECQARLEELREAQKSMVSMGKYDAVVQAKEEAEMKTSRLEGKKASKHGLQH